MVCTKCGSPLKEGAKYCGNCGQLVVVKNSTSPAPQSTPVSVQSPQNTQIPTFVSQTQPTMGPSKKQAKTIKIITTIFALIIGLTIGYFLYIYKPIPKGATKNPVIETDCYKFKLAGYFVVQEKAECGVIAVNYSITSAVAWLPANLKPLDTPSSLAYTDKQYIEWSQKYKVISTKDTIFGGKPAYKIVLVDRCYSRGCFDTYYTLYYVFGEPIDLTVKDNGKNTNLKSSLYVIKFSGDARSTSNFERDLQNSWSWQTQASTNQQVATPTLAEVSNDSLKVQTVDTPCFSVPLPTQGRVTHKINDCDLTVELGDNQLSSMQIHQFARSTASLEEDVNYWKSFNKEYAIVSENDLKVGQNQAHQIVYKLVKDDTFTQTIVFVYTGNKYEKVFQDPVNGFEISGPYTQESNNSKSTFDYALSYWSWK